MRHMASELNLNMQSDGYVKVQDLLELNMKTFAQIPLTSHTVDDIREVGHEMLLCLSLSQSFLANGLFDVWKTVTAVECRVCLKHVIL